MSQNNFSVNYELVDKNGKMARERFMESVEISRSRDGVYFKISFNEDINIDKGDTLVGFVQEEPLF